MARPTRERFQTDPDLEDLGEILRVDQRRRWLIGDRVPAEHLLREHPRAARDEELAVDLVYGEYLVREELGEVPSIDEYALRFPAYASTLRMQADFDSAISPRGAGELLRRRMADSGTFDRRTTNPVSSPRNGPEMPLPVVPGFRVLSVLGSGGMGTVYAATELGSGRAIALKMITVVPFPALDREATICLEAEALSRLGHHNIVQLYEVGEHEGRPFLVLELANGGSLADRVGGQPWSPRLAAELVATLARAVQHAHGRGIVHGDLKPENVLFDATGRPMLTDFGLARVVDWSRAGGPGSSDLILGTPPYMAPEQAGLAGGYVVPSVDLYALGAILYELLTGRPPFWSETPIGTIQLVLTQDPIPPTRLRPDVPRQLEAICLACLQKDPMRRYGDAGALAEELDDFASGGPIQARPQDVRFRVGRG